MYTLELVVVGIQGRNIGLETLAYTDIPGKFFELAALVERS